VFVSSFITHMVLPYHRSDVLKLSGGNEDEVLDVLRRINVTPGDYAAPHAGSPAGMKDPAFIAKATKRPAGIHDDRPWRATVDGTVPRAVVCVLRSHRHLCRLRRGNRVRTRCRRHDRSPGRQHGCVHGVRNGIAGAFDLVSAKLVNDDEICLTA
jgi:hypothetical protein